MAKQGSTYEGPLSVKEGGLKLFDPIRPTSKHSEERFGRVVLTSAQLLAAVAGTTLFNLVPAPGANKYIEWLSGALVMKHGGTAYTGQGPVRFYAGATIGGAGAVMVSFAMLLSAFSSATGDVVLQCAGGTGASVVLPVNAPLGLAWLTGTPNAELTGGNGQMIVLFSYRIHDIGV
jgi:hypothetical protein